MKTGATVAAFARPVRLRPIDRRSTPCIRTSPIAPRTSSLGEQTQRRKLRRTRPERSAWPEPEPTSSGPWQPREPMLPDDRDFGPAMARLTQRQRIFVDGLFCGLKQTAAARRAGYSNRGHADAVAAQTVRKPRLLDCSLGVLWGTRCRRERDSNPRSPIRRTPFQIRSATSSA